MMKWDINLEIWYLFPLYPNSFKFIYELHAMFLIITISLILRSNKQTNEMDRICRSPFWISELLFIRSDHATAFLMEPHLFISWRRKTNKWNLSNSQWMRKNEPVLNIRTYFHVLEELYPLYCIILFQIWKMQEWIGQFDITVSAI